MLVGAELNAELAKRTEKGAIEQKDQKEQKEQREDPEPPMRLIA
jgi:hypothetical protein